MIALYVGYNKSIMPTHNHGRFLAMCFNRFHSFPGSLHSSLTVLRHAVLGPSRRPSWGSWTYPLPLPRTRRNISFLIIPTPTNKKRWLEKMGISVFYWSIMPTRIQYPVFFCFCELNSLISLCDVSHRVCWLTFNNFCDVCICKKGLSWDVHYFESSVSNQDKTFFCESCKLTLIRCFSTELFGHYNYGSHLMLGTNFPLTKILITKI